MLRILMYLLPILEDGFFSRLDAATKIKETLCNNNPFSTQQIFEHP